MVEPFRIFIGFDDRESVAYHVLAHSILSRASVPVTVMPLVQSSLREAGLYWRERGPTESTAFSMTRFLVPHLSGYYGHSLFLDCDMLCRVDIQDLRGEWVRATMNAIKTRLPDPAVMVCQHDYEPKPDPKFLGQQQTSYVKKNWSSVMYFDNGKCRALTPEYVNSATGLELHRFQWLRQDAEVAALPLAWNHLVGEYEPNPDAKIVHWTLGGPYFPEYRDAEFADEWRAERDRAFGAAQPAVQAA